MSCRFGSWRVDVVPDLASESRDAFMACAPPAGKSAPKTLAKNDRVLRPQIMPPAATL